MKFIPEPVLLLVVKSRFIIIKVNGNNIKVKSEEIVWTYSIEASGT